MCMPIEIIARISHKPANATNEQFVGQPNENGPNPYARICIYSTHTAMRAPYTNKK